MIIVIAISKHFSSDKSSVRGRFSIAIFDCQYIMYIRNYQNIIVFLKDDVMEI